LCVTNLGRLPRLRECLFWRRKSAKSDTFSEGFARPPTLERLRDSEFLLQTYFTEILFSSRESSWGDARVPIAREREPHETHENCRYCRPIGHFHRRMGRGPAASARHPSTRGRRFGRPLRRA